MAPCRRKGISILIILQLLVTLFGLSDGYYHLATADSACQATTNEGKTLDLVCHVDDKRLKACKIYWQKLDNGSGQVQNITDSATYGIWDAVPGWGISEGDYVSLLRVRDVTPRVLGQYQCEMVCQDDHGEQKVMYRQVSICLQQPNAKYSVCKRPRLIDRKTAVNSVCRGSFRDGICNDQCDNADNLFDGFDCAEKLNECNPTYDPICKPGFANGQCDRGCDTPACGWDGGDCVNTPLNFADSTIVLFIPKRYQSKLAQRSHLVHLGRAFSRLLRTIVRVLPEDLSSRNPKAVRSNEQLGQMLDNGRKVPPSGSKVYLKLDNSQCQRRCFKDARTAARFIEAALYSGWDPGIPIQMVGGVVGTENHCALVNNTLLNIDLSSVAGRGAAYKQQTTGQSQQAENWLLVVCLAGTAVLVVIVIIAISVACARRRKALRKEKHRWVQVAQVDSTHIGVTTDTPSATHV